MQPSIFVISLPRDTGRRRQVACQLRSFGLPWTIFDAFDGLGGAAIFEAIDRRGFLLNTGRSVTAGEIGCFASHRGLWQRCAAGERPFCILEDDCRLQDRFPRALKAAGSLADRYGFIRLQHETRARKRVVACQDGFELHRYTRMANSTLAYVVSPNAATRLLAASSIMDAPVDILIKRFWRHGQALHGLTPYSASESDLSANTSIGLRNPAAKNLSERLGRTTTRLRWLYRRTVFNLTDRG